MTENRSGNPASGEDAEVEKSVLAYLDGHPQAADTLQGIVNWWLPRQRYERDRRRIEQALGALVLQGKLRRSPLPGGDVLYERQEGIR
jgi:hypothetical protein